MGQLVSLRMCVPGLIRHLTIYEDVDERHGRGVLSNAMAARIESFVPPLAAV
jgi:hypothetical protein